MAKYDLPPTPTESEPEVRMSHCLERIVSLGATHPDTVSWWQRTAKGAANKYIKELPDGMQGRSWNHAVAAGTLYALMENKHWNKLKTYAIHQLDGTHKGLWGQEGVSHNYPHPIPYIAVAYQKNQLPELKRLLRAHAFTLALLALPKPYNREARDDAEDPQGPYGKSSTKLSQHVCAGGMRSQWNYRGNVYLSYALEIMRGKTPKLPTWRGTDTRRQGSHNRVMRHTGHAYLTQADRDLIDRVIFESDVEPLVAELQDLGVRSWATLHVLRWPADQGASYYERNTHSSTPPIMGQSWIRNHGYRTLCMHPGSHRGAGNNSVGEVTAERVGNEIRGKAVGVKAGGELGDWPPCKVNGVPAPGSRKGTVEASIPLPTDNLLWEVVIDRTGVRLEGGGGGNDDNDDNDDNGGGGSGGGDDVKRALLLFDQVARSSTDPWIQQGIATGAEVMRRVERRVKAKAVKGSKTLTRQLEKPLSKPTGSADDPRVIKALGLFSRAARSSGDTWVQRGIEVGAEVMRRISWPNQEKAVKGSKTLTRKLES